MTHSEYLLWLESYKATVRRRRRLAGYRRAVINHEPQPLKLSHTSALVRNAAKGRSVRRDIA